MPIFTEIILSFISEASIKWETINQVSAAGIFLEQQR